MTEVREHFFDLIKGVTSDQRKLTSVQRERRSSLGTVSPTLIRILQLLSTLPCFGVLSPYCLVEPYSESDKH